MAAYAVFLPGQLGTLDPAKVTGAGAITQVAGLYLSGVTGASAAAAAAAVQAALPTPNQQGLMQVALVSNTTTA